MLIGLAILIGCDFADSCRDIACMPPPLVEIGFRVVDSSGNDLIAINSITEENITLTNSETNTSDIPYIYDNTAVFSFWNGEHEYILNINDSHFQIASTVSQKPRDEGECCSGFQLDEFILDGKEISVESDYTVEIVID